MPPLLDLEDPAFTPDPGLETDIYDAVVADPRAIEPRTLFVDLSTPAGPLPSPPSTSGWTTFKEAQVNLVEDGAIVSEFVELSGVFDVVLGGLVSPPAFVTTANFQKGTEIVYQVRDADLPAGTNPEHKGWQIAEDRYWADREVGDDPETWLDSEFHREFAVEYINQR